MYCPICGNPNAGRRHGVHFENEFYCGECQKSFEEKEWYKLHTKLLNKAIKFWFDNLENNKKADKNPIKKI